MRFFVTQQEVSDIGPGDYYSPKKWDPKSYNSLYNEEKRKISIRRKNYLRKNYNKNKLKN